MAAQKPRRILRLPAVKSKTGLGHDSIYRLMADGSFPRQVKLSERAVGWVEHEVDEWIERRAKSRDAAHSARTSA